MKTSMKTFRIQVCSLVRKLCSVNSCETLLMIEFMVYKNAMHWPNIPSNFLFPPFFCNNPFSQSI